MSFSRTSSNIFLVKDRFITRTYSREILFIDQNKYTENQMHGGGKICGILGANMLGERPK